MPEYACGKTSDARLNQNMCKGLLLSCGGCDNFIGQDRVALNHKRAGRGIFSFTDGIWDRNPTVLRGSFGCSFHRVVIISWHTYDLSIEP